MTTIGRIMMIAVTLITAVALSSCNSTPPQFQGGIRWGAFVALATNPTDTVPLGGAVDSGTWLYAMSGITHGTQQFFEGTTRATDGYDDHPNAQDNSVWDLYMNFQPAEPECPNIGPGGGNPPFTEPPTGAVVPDGGAVFQAVCQL